jgi:hypothetical protein
MAPNCARLPQLTGSLNGRPDQDVPRQNPSFSIKNPPNTLHLQYFGREERNDETRPKHQQTFQKEDGFRDGQNTLCE